MSLYDDIHEEAEEAPKTAEDDRKWPQSSSLSLLRDHCLHVKRIHSHRKPKHVKTSSSAPPSTEAPIAHVAINYGDDSQRGRLLGGEWDVGDEYDPFWPNDYEMRAKESEKGVKRALIGSDYDSNDESEDKEPARAGAQIAPPAALLDAPPETDEFSAGVSSVAKNIMKRMGYKSGSGLGLNEQGISRALHVEQHVVGKRAPMGKIVAEEKEAPPEREPEVLPITEVLRNPTKKVVLRNLVTRGQVDDDLNEEVRDECLKYGHVVRVGVEEAPSGLQVTEDEEVRVVVEFGRVEEAIKAVVDLNGRFFGGRQVRASFE